jgi:putative ABC transport system permease protein
MGLRQLRASVIGEAGLSLALALAGITALTTFVVAAGPRELAAEQDTAVHQAAAALPVLDRAIYASASWIPEPGQPATFPTLSQQAKLTDAMIRNMAPPISPERASSRIWIAGSLFTLVKMTKGLANTGVFSTAAPPLMQVSYDSELAADSTLVAGHLPDRIGVGEPTGPSRYRDALVVQVALTQPTATTFAVHVGSFMEQSAPDFGHPVYLQVTGIVAPRPGQFWNSTQVVTTPDPPSRAYPGWIGGAVIGQSELSRLQATLWLGKNVQGIWYVPVSLRALTPALLGPLTNAVSSQAVGSYGQSAGDASGFKFPQAPVLSSPLQTDLTTLRSQLATTNSLVAFVIAGIFAAALLLILLCAGLAADRYQAEFSLIRARGGSVGQVARLAIARAAGSAGPGFIVGLAVTVLVLRQGNEIVTAWLLPAVAALFALVCVPLRSAWRVRRGARPADAGRSEVAVPRRSPRRAVAELTVVLACAAAVIALQTRGLASGGNELALAIPLLVAAVVSIALARLYPLPVRLLIPMTVRRRGAVSFLGLARAGRSGLSTILPALALVLTMTLAAFGWMVTRSVYAGQVAASWAETGADAVVTAAGGATISTSDQRAFARVRGVRHTALVYTVAAGSLGTATLFPVSGPNFSTGYSFNPGVLIAEPGQYAAMARDTPWPTFPAGALARRSGPVPILISAGAAAHDQNRAVIGTRQVLSIGGVTALVVVAGTISATPAFPAGGSYIVLPQWAASRFPSIPGMTIMLATGPRLNLAAMTAVARKLVPGSQVAIRALLLRNLRTAASQYTLRLFIMTIWLAVALSLVAMAFGLAATGQSRRHLRSRMATLGMSAREASTLALTDAIPLLSVAILGTAGAGAALVLISGQVINLGPLTGSAGEVPVSLDWPGLVVPAAAAVILALAAIGFENWRTGRGEPTTALRTEQAE